ncbi:phosphatase PAP2 family protein [Pedobacter panaciterrae]|jgi:membrane-associated phospholipid phosphatase|uniref:Phosphatase PAP2 family protein n=1 Tax=Pedobacter panaciterrae TaxID=363849 RepID=A0ABU8NSJ8_9SPHI|nr:phosphatase PAP2 family protein [Pedobacter panaciterrae]
MYRKLLVILVLFTIPGLIFAQTQDTLQEKGNFRSDSSMMVSSNYKPKVTAFIIPAVFIGYGVVSLTGDNVIRRLDYSTKDELQEDHPLFAAHADDYMQFAPAAAVYGLNLLGIKGKHSLLDATGLYVLSSAIMGGSVTALKKATHRLRPNGSGYTSFPSGHTANAFAAAEFLKQEYKDVSPWYGYAGYTVAIATGVLRTYNNKHWASDVVAGAGFGILSTKLSYLLYPKLKKLITGKGSFNYTVMPSYQQHSMGLSLSGTF